MTLSAQSLDGFRWSVGVSQYQGGRSDYGVRRDDGRWLSFDGKSPYRPAGGRRTATEVAETVIVDSTLHWLDLGGVR